ncbi:MAG: adenylyltransferase/cytidyltransferase family protein [Deltaproteobacteria bacterium]|nr:adenylyltransferase/cytidyltransferase family protein [Deltaproteobacteria bacterium]MBW1735964.1 adenylyltransferase/cytidyltransferase family protein [Deltaproteobacteria bacterium]MBW1908273.1 adenylyltransferase/cytidyltransferase family protein [Deltaproteobacteria bacterium]MBW2032255.1 adenylyltransferase/cytidyltransferase family protein [Deltaproteobacteria bacterium]MBW2113268.1 adenylyltransferase/cytidyltransferase family protein [Deltaproteobacteria bacterium]
MKLVYSYYVLDIVHKGHLLMMRNAKAIAGKDGKSIVGILTDTAVMEKKEKPILSFEERIELAGAIKYVDVAVAQETYSPLPNVMRIRPDILMESTSHDEEAIEKAREYMESINGKVVVLPYFPAQSSTDIKNNIIEKEIRPKIK